MWLGLSLIAHCPTLHAVMPLQIVEANGQLTRRYVANGPHCWEMWIALIARQLPPLQNDSQLPQAVSALQTTIARLSLQKFSRLRFASLMASLEPTISAPSSACSVMSQPSQQRQNSKGNRDWRGQDKALASCHRARGRFSSRHSTE
jgi:hypothetical protein